MEFEDGLDHDVPLAHLARRPGSPELEVAGDQLPGQMLTVVVDVVLLDLHQQPVEPEQALATQLALAGRLLVPGQVVGDLGDAPLRTEELELGSPLQGERVPWLPVRVDSLSQVGVSAYALSDCDWRGRV